MIRGRVLRAADESTLLSAVHRTSNALERAQGLLGRAPLAPGEALLIDRCACVHTLGMRYPLDIAYLDRGGQVLKLVASLRPMRVSACPRASMTLEMPPESIGRLELTTGQRLRWQADAPR